MGESWNDRIDMAISLSELQIDSIPINALIPIKGTHYENISPLAEDDILRTIAIFHYINQPHIFVWQQAEAILKMVVQTYFCLVLTQ